MLSRTCDAGEVDTDVWMTPCRPLCSMWAGADPRSSDCAAAQALLLCRFGASPATRASLKTVDWPWICEDSTRPAMQTSRAPVSGRTGGPVISESPTNARSAGGQTSSSTRGSAQHQDQVHWWGSSQGRAERRTLEVVAVRGRPHRTKDLVDLRAASVPRALRHPGDTHPGASRSWVPVGETASSL